MVTSISKLCVKVASRVAKWLETSDPAELKSIRKIWNLGGTKLPFSLPEIKHRQEQLKECKSIYQNFPALSSFTRILYFVPSIRIYIGEYWNIYSKYWVCSSLKKMRTHCNAKRIIRKYWFLFKLFFNFSSAFTSNFR